MFFRNILLCSLCFILLACNKDHADDPLTPETVYTYGSNCGWCYNDFELVVNQELFDLKTTEISGDCIFDNFSSSADAATLEALEALLNFETFKQIELSTDHISYDGCDYYLKIQHDGEEHSIRYGYPEMDQVQSIQPLIDKLKEVKASMF